MERKRELDFADVELIEAVDGWPVGTAGVIVDAFTEKAIVEIADEDGRTLDLLTVPYSVVKIHEREGHLAY